jgi:4-azaleucine resistance transporter AzlC
MRSAHRTTKLRRDPLIGGVLAIAAAAFVVGVSYGAISTAAGESALVTIAMSVFVFAGGSQFLAVGIVSAGGSAIAAVLAGLLLNARHLPFGLVIGDTLGRSWSARLIGSHLMVDESVAFALAQEDAAQRRRAYWACGITLFFAWNLGTAFGVAAGNAVGDPAAFGVDAAFPAAILALLLPSLRDSRALRVALGGAVLALITTPLLPAGLPVLVALLGVAFALPVPKKDFS